MTEARLALGAQGESLAAAYLCDQGFVLVRRNFRCPLGEIDIIAEDRTHLLFVEVKTRRSTVFGLPQDAVGPRKQRQLIRAAQWYLKTEKNTRRQPRFDVIAVLLQPGRSPKITHLQNAFTLDG